MMRAYSSILSVILAFVPTALSLELLDSKFDGDRRRNLRALQRQDHDNLANEVTRWCDSVNQSYDPRLSCSSLTVEASGTKCVPTTGRITCEAYLMGIFLNFGKARADLVSRLQGCKCEYLPWNGRRGGLSYDVQAIGGSTYSAFEGPVVVGTDMYWSALEIGILRKDEQGVVSVFVAATDEFVPHGLAYDATTDSIVVCSAEMTGRGAVYRVEADKTLTSLTEGVTLNAPNDLVVTNNGDVYFTDPLWRLMQSPQADEMGVYSILFDKKNPVVTREYTLTATLDQPNGIALTDDETKLYVSLTGTSRIIQFNVTQDTGALVYDGNVVTGRQGVKYLPDGMTIKDDFLYVATNMDFIEVIDLSGNRKSYSIDLYEAGIYGVSNLAFDETDGTMYMTETYPGKMGSNIYQLNPN